MQDIIQKIKQGVSQTEQIDNAIELLKTTLSESGLFFAHSLRTGLILRIIGADQFTIACGILHDIPEKLSGETAEVIKKMWQLRHLCTPKKAPKIKPFKKWQKEALWY